MRQRTSKILKGHEFYISKGLELNRTRVHDLFLQWSDLQKYELLRCTARFLNIQRIDVIVAQNKKGAFKNANITWNKKMQYVQMYAGKCNLDMNSKCTNTTNLKLCRELSKRCKSWWDILIDIENFK